MKIMTRQERRTERQGRFVTAKEARLAARLARLDYKVSGETGALRVPSKSRLGQPGSRADSGGASRERSRKRAGPTYVVESGDLGRFPKPIIHHKWRRLMTDK